MSRFAMKTLDISCETPLKNILRKTLFVRDIIVQGYLPNFHSICERLQKNEKKTKQLCISFDILKSLGQDN